MAKIRFSSVCNPYLCGENFIANRANMKTTLKTAGWYHVMAAVTVMIWGTTFVSTKVLIKYGLSPVDILFYRFLLAYICIWFFSQVQRIIHIGDREIFIRIDRLFFFDFGFRCTFSIGAGLMTVF